MVTRVDTKSNLIARYDNVIPEQICERITQYVIDQKPKNSIRQGALPWQNNDNITFVNIKDIEIKKLIDAYRYLFTQLVFQHYNEIVYPTFSDLVVWREGMKMAYHKDNGYEGRSQDVFRMRKYSMVAYLNHDFEGGETVIKLLDGSEYISIPKQGSVVIFKSNEECMHCVQEVTEGTRITLPTWFTSDIKHVETMNGCLDQKFIRLL